MQRRWKKTNEKCPDLKLPKVGPKDNTYLKSLNPSYQGGEEGGGTKKTKQPEEENYPK